MKKLLFSAIALMATNFAFGQITLEHSFFNESVYIYKTPTEMYLVSGTTDNKIKLYNIDYSLAKTVNVPVPTGYTMAPIVAEQAFTMSKNIFNTDSKYEFLVDVYSETQLPRIKLLLINEDGTLLKDFHTNPDIMHSERFEVFHNDATNTNKLIIGNNTQLINNNYIYHTEIYSLPTSSLTTKEIQTGSKLSAFPIPTNKILNIANPGNGANKIEVFDVTGKLVANKSFSTSENKISIDVENLPKGIYIYKIGNLSSKFTKN